MAIPSSAEPSPAPGRLARCMVQLLIGIIDNRIGAMAETGAKLMVFTLIQAAAKSWRRLNGRNQLPKVIDGVRFRNGVEMSQAMETNAA